MHAIARDYPPNLAFGDQDRLIFIHSSSIGLRRWLRTAKAPPCRRAEKHQSSD